jgi:hypothetical protein
VNANVPQGEIDHNLRQRFGVTRDDENFLVRQRVCLIAQQFTTPLNADWSRLLFRTIRQVHGAPLERESQRFVLDGWRALARRCVGRRADVRVSADAGLKPASSRRSCAPSGDDREWVDRLLRSVRPGRGNASGERIRLSRRMILKLMRDERSRVSQLIHVPTERSRMSATDCDVLRIALDAEPCGRRPDARSVGRCGERRECRAALT